MKILFTGASSFTGMWFVKALQQAGHEVIALFRKKEYDGIRKQRVEIVKKISTARFGVTFGDAHFLDILKNESFDLLCHHGANVENYRSPDFDFIHAAKSNCDNIQQVMQKGIRRILLTGSLFEPNEGTGSTRAVSPYGLSKGLTSEVFHYFCSLHNVQLGKFVIPNPFGPYEEGRFTNYLAKTWLKKKTAEVKAPEYIRDNIPVQLLAKEYASFVTSMFHTTKSYQKSNPSCYRGTQGEFTKRFANELSMRWNLPCHYTLLKQTDFFEPLSRVNTHPVEIKKDEKQIWDEVADYYMEQYGS